MNMTDPIADMLTRIRNAATARHTLRIGSSLENEAEACACAQRRRLY